MVFDRIILLQSNLLQGRLSKNPRKQYTRACCICVRLLKRSVEYSVLDQKSYSRTDGFICAFKSRASLSGAALFLVLFRSHILKNIPNINY